MFLKTYFFTSKVSILLVVELAFEALVYRQPTKGPTVSILLVVELAFEAYIGSEAFYNYHKFQSFL